MKRKQKSQNKERMIDIYRNSVDVLCNSRCDRDSYFRKNKARKIRNELYVGQTDSVKGRTKR